MNPPSLIPATRVLIVLAGVIFTACKPSGEPAAIIEEMPEAKGDAYLVLPGDYAQKTTVADLENRFGRTHVRRETEPEPRVVLFPDDPTRRAYVYFHEREAFKELAHIFVSDAGSRWRGKHGVHLGMTMAKVRELNGKPFHYSGFDEQKRGRVHDGWSVSVGDNDGTPGAFDVAEEDHLYFNIEFGVGDPSRLKSAADLPPDESLTSDDPRFPHLGEAIVVTGIGASSSLDDEWE